MDVVIIVFSWNIGIQSVYVMIFMHRLCRWYFQCLCVTFCLGRSPQTIGLVKSASLPKLEARDFGKVYRSHRDLDLVSSGIEFCGPVRMKEPKSKAGENSFDIVPLHLEISKNFLFISLLSKICHNILADVKKRLVTSQCKPHSIWQTTWVCLCW